MSIDCCVSPKEKFFSEQEISIIQKTKIPRHVAIIMDGNRRWAQKGVFPKLNSQFGGHWAGAKALVDIVAAAQEIGIHVLTVYAFSTENWSRSKKEIDLLFHIFEVYLDENREKMIREGVRFHAIGDLVPFPESLKNKIVDLEIATEKGKAIDFVVAMNYGSRCELKKVASSLAKKCVEGTLRPEEITEEMIGSVLETARWGDPDLVIRTSGEQRISNFLLWQIAYSELYITPVLWPDFTPRDLLKAVADYQGRVRRLGR